MWSRPARPRCCKAPNGGSSLTPSQPRPRADRNPHLFLRPDRCGAEDEGGDLRPRGSAWTIRLHETGGKRHAMPCHRALAEMLHAYIAAAGIAEDRKNFLFRTSRGHTVRDRRGAGPQAAHHHDPLRAPLAPADGGDGDGRRADLEPAAGARGSRGLTTTREREARKWLPSFLPLFRTCRLYLPWS
jgi:hypothetical protein